MNRVSQIVLARRALALKLAHQHWLQEQSSSTTIALLRATAVLCRELAASLHELAVHNESDKVRQAEDLVRTTTLFCILADTSTDSEAAQGFRRHHLLGMSTTFSYSGEPLTPANLSVNVADELALLDSYCERLEIDQWSAFGLLRSFCDLGEQLGFEVYRIAPGIHTAEVILLAHSAVNYCFAYC